MLRRVKKQELVDRMQIMTGGINMKILKEKLSSKEEKMVSGGSEASYASGEGTFQKNNGKHFEIICDACRKVIPGKSGVLYDSQGNDYCVDCAMKKQAILKESGINERYRFDNLDYAKDSK